MGGQKGAKGAKPDFNQYRPITRSGRMAVVCSATDSIKAAHHREQFNLKVRY
jgi:hypothetical protein